jgi:hypothetical protein
MNKKIILIGIVILLICVIFGFGINIIMRPSTSVVAPLEDNIIDTTSPNQLAQVQWKTPTKVENLKIFKSDFNVIETAYSWVTFYRVGTFTDGIFKGGDILVADVVTGEMGGESRYFFINKSGQITLLTKHSDALYDGDSLDRTKFSIDTDAVLTDLIFPEKINYGTSSFSLQWNNISEGFAGQTYYSSAFKLAFKHPKLGDVYADNPDDQTITNKKNGYYLIAPDGTERTYSLDIPFYDKTNIPQVTWNDGTLNTTEYINTDRGGCGSRNYAAVVYGLSLNDLVVIGETNSGDKVYELKDDNNMILHNIYNNDYNPYDTPKISYEQFIQSKPVFFWYDSFGRLIKFQKSEFIPQAECGKPVIYLYPEETTNVSVKIEPKGGFTFTEPDYGDGWDVLAYPDGKLVDLENKISYPYLFWEGRGGIYNTPEKGFVVAVQDVHNFLIEKLTKLGLNDKEQVDFIEFWEPRMTGAPYFFVTFMGNKVMDEIAPLTITPKPDSVIRILMDFTPLQEPITVEGYNIKTPERKGFTVIEWGGVLR